MPPRTTSAKKTTKKKTTRKPAPKVKREIDVHVELRGTVGGTSTILVLKRDGGKVTLDTKSPPNSYSSAMHVGRGSEFKCDLTDVMEAVVLLGEEVKVEPATKAATPSAGANA